MCIAYKRSQLMHLVETEELIVHYVLYYILLLGAEFNLMDLDVAQGLGLFARGICHVAGVDTSSP